MDLDIYHHNRIPVFGYVLLHPSKSIWYIRFLACKYQFLHKFINLGTKNGSINIGMDCLCNKVNTDLVVQKKTYITYPYSQPNHQCIAYGSAPLDEREIRNMLCLLRSRFVSTLLPVKCSQIDECNSFRKNIALYQISYFKISYCLPG